MSPAPDCPSSSNHVPPPALPQAPPRLEALPSLPAAATAPAPLTTSTTADKSSAELALLLSNALLDADALRRDLARTQARADRLDSELALLSSDTANDETGDKNSDGLTRLLDAEARADSAERSRDDALAALNALKTAFADLDKYEDLLAVRAADARFAFAQSLAVLSHHHSLFAPPHHPRSPLSHTYAAAAGRELGAPAAVVALPPLPEPYTGAGPHELAHAHARPGPPMLAAPSGAREHGHPLALASEPAAAGAPGAAAHGAGGMGGVGTGTSKAGGSLTRRGNDSGPFSSLALNLPPPPSATASTPTSTKRRRYDGDLRGGQVEDTNGYEQDGSRSAQWDGRELESTTNGRQTSHDGGLVPFNAPAPAMAATSTQRGLGYPFGRMDARQLVRESKERRLGLQTSSSRLRSSHSQSRSKAALNGHGTTTVVRAGQKRSRSGSRSSTGSMSLDELLLESATDAPALLAPHIQASAPHSDASSQHPPGNLNGTDTLNKNELPFGSNYEGGSVGRDGAKAAATTATQKVPASQLLTLGPSGSTISGGGAALTPAFPSHNEQGLRLCRQCGAVGRYKDRRCVEKWGPGPHGPGTVCDRCRKKTKRDELRERRNSMSASAVISGDGNAFAHQQALAHSPSYPSANHQPYHHQAQRHRSPYTVSERAVSKSRDVSPISAASAAARNGYGRDRDRNFNATPYARHRQSASLPGNGHAQGEGHVTYRSPSPDRRGPAIGLAVSSERGGASAEEVITDDGQDQNSRSSTPHIEAGDEGQGQIHLSRDALTSNAGGRRRHPSSPPVESIPSRTQQRSSAANASSLLAAEVNTAVDMDMDAPSDVDAAFLSAAASSSPEVGTAIARKRHRHKQVEQEHARSLSPSSSELAAAQAMLSAAEPAKYQRKREKVMNVGIGGPGPALASLAGPGQSQSHSDPPLAIGNLEVDVEADADADGEVDADAEGSADADLLDAAS